MPDRRRQVGPDDRQDHASAGTPAPAKTPRADAVCNHQLCGTASRKCGKRSAADITRDRYLIWKTYLLADQRDTLTARMFTAVYDQPMTRLKVQQQVAAVHRAWEEFGGEE